MLEEYDDVLTSDDVAEILKVSKSTVYRLFEEGEIHAVKIRNKRIYRTSKKNVLEYMEKL